MKDKVASKRAAGILLHPSSLPGHFEIGDIGPAAERFLDWAAAAGQRIWQVLPLGPVGDGYSPYGSLSSFAGNPMLISIERLVEDHLLDAGDAGSAVRPATHVDYRAATETKTRLLRSSFERFRHHASSELRAAHEAFRHQHSWLRDWSLFAALKSAHSEKPWWEWDPPLRDRQPAGLQRARQRLRDEVEYHEYLQFLFNRQWQRLREHARELSVSIMGDLPIYVALDSADVWTNPDVFFLDEERKPTVVAGVPPDYFSETGQRWGNPLYRWDRLAEEKFEWWIRRLEANFRQVDILRIDHFRAFAEYWEIPADEETAVNGRWLPGPGKSFFDEIRRRLPEAHLVAEDLGMITEDVDELRIATGLPGMKVLQFAFYDDDNVHMPHKHTPDMVAYTGTHDNDTTLGWLQSLDEATRKRLHDYTGINEGLGAVAQMIRLCYASVANRAIIPMQDIIGLGSEARMNVPGEEKNNWSWRALPDQFRPEAAEWLRRLAEVTGRYEPVTAL